MIVSAAHPILCALRAGSPDADGLEVRRAAEALEAALAGVALLAPTDDATTAAARFTAASSAIADARRVVVNIAGGPMASAMRYLDGKHRDLYKTARERFGPGQGVVSPPTEPLS